MVIQCKVPGSCGELIQGMIDGEPFLVTCPIDLYASAAVYDNRPPGQSGFGEKSKLALRKVLELFKMDQYPYYIALESALPHSKGMASSSAEIAAVCQAAAISLGRELSNEQIAQIAVSIEPTDGVFYPGVVKMNHLTGICQEDFGLAPPMQIAIFDTGGTVDTLSFNRRADLNRLHRQNESKIAAALDLLREGMKTQDIRKIGAAATGSAMAHQSILYKPELEALLETAMRCGAAGITVAHSGTVLGVLFAADQTSARRSTIARIKAAFPTLHFLRTVRLISGGCIQVGGAEALKYDII